MRHAGSKRTRSRCRQYQGRGCPALTAFYDYRARATTKWSAGQTVPGPNPPIQAAATASLAATVLPPRLDVGDLVARLRPREPASGAQRRCFTARSARRSVVVPAVCTPARFSIARFLPALQNPGRLSRQLLRLRPIRRPMPLLRTLRLAMNMNNTPTVPPQFVWDTVGLRHALLVAILSGMRRRRGDGRRKEPSQGPALTQDPIVPHTDSKPPVLAR